MFCFLSFFFGGRRKLQSCCHGFGRHWGKGFSFSFGLLPEEPELPDSDGRPGRRRTSKETFQLCCRDAETVDAVRSSFFFGITALTDSKTLTGGQSNLYVVCMYQLFEKKKRKKVAVAEPSVTFDVVEVCLPFCHFCHSQPMYALIFLTESAS